MLSVSLFYSYFSFLVTWDGNAIVIVLNRLLLTLMFRQLQCASNIRTISQSPSASHEMDFWATKINLFSATFLALQPISAKNCLRVHLLSFCSLRLLIAVVDRAVRFRFFIIFLFCRNRSFSFYWNFILIILTSDIVFTIRKTKSDSSTARSSLNSGKEEFPRSQNWFGFL